MGRLDEGPCPPAPGVGIAGSGREADARDPCSSVRWGVLTAARLWGRSWAGTGLDLILWIPRTGLEARVALIWLRLWGLALGVPDGLGPAVCRGLGWTARASVGSCRTL